MNSCAKWAGVCVLTAATLAMGQATQPAKKHARLKPILSQQVVSADSGGTRGGAFPYVDILVPTQVSAVTTQTQPTLCWWVEKPLPDGFQCTLIDTATDDAVTDKPISVPPVTTGGWQTIDLARSGVTLKPGHKYQWNFSAAVSDQADAAKPRVEPRSTVIEVIEPPADVAKALAAASGVDRLQLLIDHGYWLDAAAAAVHAEQGNPADPDAKRTVADLVDAFGRSTLAKALATAGQR